MKSDSHSEQSPALPSRATVEDARRTFDRRTLLRAGASVTPVLLTLRSGPVSAHRSGCINASAFGSAAALASRNGGSVTVDCGRRHCEWWRNEARAGHHGNQHLNRSVAACLGEDRRNSFNGWSCKDVMAHPSGIATAGELAVVQHLIALVSNCEAGAHNASNPTFNAGYLRMVRHNYYDSGRSGYRMTGLGQAWSEAQLIAWLRTMLGYSVG